MYKVANRGLVDRFGLETLAKWEQTGQLQWESNADTTKALKGIYLFFTCPKSLIWPIS
jgi:hypothetical protein